jgi:hypothetical protein
VVPRRPVLGSRVPDRNWPHPACGAALPGPGGGVRVDGEVRWAKGGDAGAENGPRLLDLVREAARLKRCSRRTEVA